MIIQDGLNKLGHRLMTIILSNLNRFKKISSLRLSNKPFLFLVINNTTTP